MEFKKFLEKIFSKEKGIKILVILGFTGMILILLPEFFFVNKNEKKEEKQEAADYAEYITEAAEKILGKIEGVGRVSVMLTTDGTEEYIYEKESRENNSSSESGKSVQSEYECILVQKDGEKEALVKKVIHPEIKGVVVVCEGGNNSIIQEKICSALSVALDIPTNRIYVAGLQK